MGPEKTSIVKYGKYIRKLVDSVDRNHFTFCCFEERFSKNADFFGALQSGDSVGLLLKAFKYITDLLININSYHYANPLPHSRNYAASAGMHSDDDASFINEYLPEHYGVRRVSTPHDNIPFSSIETANTCLSGRSGFDAATRNTKNSQERYHNARSKERDNYVSITEVEPSTGRKSYKEGGRRTEKPRRNNEMRDSSYSEEDEDADGGYRGDKGKFKSGSEEERLIKRFKELRNKCKELRGEISERGEAEERSESNISDARKSRKDRQAGGEQNPFYAGKTDDNWNQRRLSGGSSKIVL